MTNTQKFHYLKGALSGEALDVLKGWRVTDEHYDQAYRTLIETYDDQYRVIMAHVEQLLNQEHQKTESYSGLRKLIDVTRQEIRQLRDVGYQIDTWDHVIVYILVSRMAPRTKQAWETNRQGIRMPTSNEVIQFLSSRARSLSTANDEKEKLELKPYSGARNNGNKPKQSVPSNINNTTTPNCHLCKQPHPLYRCAKFKALSIDDRRKKVREMNLCFNCFTPNHRAGTSNCKWGPCKRCPNEFHNTILCKVLQQQVVSNVGIMHNGQNCLSASAPLWTPSTQITSKKN